MFDIHIGVWALITTKHAGKPVSFGPIVCKDTSGMTSMIGEDGQIYLGDLSLKGELLVQWGEGANARCVVYYALPGGSLKRAVTLMNITYESPTVRQE